MQRLHQTGNTTKWSVVVAPLERKRESSRHLPAHNRYLFPCTDSMELSAPIANVVYPSIRYYSQPLVLFVALP